jgi:hypothetical protein
VIDHDVALCIHAYYADELPAGRRACERLLSQPLEQATEQMVRANRTYYTQTLDELVACRFVRIDVEPAHEGWSLFNPTVINHAGELVGVVRSSNYRITDGQYVIPPEDGGKIRTQNLLVRFGPDLRPVSCRPLVADYPADQLPSRRPRGLPATAHGQRPGSVGHRPQRVAV